MVVATIAVEPGFFFTDVDPEIALKDSRDPLGSQPIWGFFGRQLIGNLTTVTTSVRGFTTLILGHYLASDLVRSGRVAANLYVDPFLRLEQLVAYSRIAWAKETGDDIATIRGIRRAQARLVNGGGCARVSADQDGQILASQKTYGLWGLYSVASVSSGFLLPSRVGVSPDTQRFVEQQMLPAFERRGAKFDSLLKLLEAAETNFEPRLKQSAIGRALAEIHRPTFVAEERAFYLPRLVEGTICKSDGAQAALWQLLKVHNDAHNGWKEEFGMKEVETLLAHKAISTGAAEDTVIEWLGRIRVLEQVLAPAQQLFGYILQQRNQLVTAISKELQGQWGRGLRYIDVDGIIEARTFIDAAAREQGTAGTSTRLVELARALRDGDFEACIALVLTQNQTVMARRGGAPWAEIRNGRIEVIYAGESDVLMERSSAPLAWTNTYFLNALKIVGGSLLGKST